MGIEEAGSRAMGERNGFETPVPEGRPNEESNLAASQHCWRRAIQPGSDIESESAGGQAGAAAESMPSEPQRANEATISFLRKQGDRVRMHLVGPRFTIVSEWQATAQGQ